MGTAFDFTSAQKEAEKAGMLSSGDYLKLKEGGNRIRLMSECLAHKGTYQGKPNFKWLCYVIDRNDGKVKPFFMPHTIYKQIAALQSNEDYHFSEVPMPYDLTISADGAGTKEVKYALMPARKESPVTALEFQMLTDAKPLKELQKKLLEKQASGQGGQDEHISDEQIGAGQVADDDPIPF